MARPDWPSLIQRRSEESSISSAAGGTIRIRLRKCRRRFTLPCRTRHLLETHVSPIPAMNDVVSQENEASYPDAAGLALVLRRRSELHHPVPPTGPPDAQNPDLCVRARRRTARRVHPAGPPLPV